MADWEGRLGEILNDPQAMSRIMELAQSLGGGDPSPGPEPLPEDTAPETGPAPALDPRLMELGMRALRAWQDPGDARTALLRALRPFVKPERYAKVDKAAQIARLSRVVREVLDGWKGEGEDV